MESMRTNLDSSLKKPYNPPALRVYGVIQDLTETTANMGNLSDTRGVMDSRTH